MTIDELLENFEFITEWEERYRYVIDLGRQLPEMPEELKTDDRLVPGCMSKVWFEFQSSDETPQKIHFLADSDAHIVKGLAAILKIIYSGKTAEEASKINLEEIFKQLGLEGHLSMNRRNGFYSMAQKIREFASQ